MKIAWLSQGFEQKLDSMKKLMTVIIAAAMLLAGTDAFAQFSVSVGYSHSRTNFKALGLNLAKAMMDGFYGGVTYNIPFARVGTGTLGVAPGLYVSYMMKPETNLYVVKGDISESYLTVPVDFNLSLPVTDGLRFIIFAGPSFSAGLTSDVKVSAIADKDLSESIIGTNNDMYDGLIAQKLGYNRFDVLVGGGIGLDFEDMIRLTVGYDAGMLNRGGNTLQINRNQLHVGLAYLF